MFFQPQFHHTQPDPRITARTNKQGQTIVVYGEGVVSAQPDEANITVGIISDGETLQETQEENSTTSANVISALLQLGIPEENIQTVAYRVDMQYDYIDGQQVFRGYRVNHQLQITIENIEQTGLVVDTAIANGANSVSNIQFSLSDPSEKYSEALRLAIRSAENKANVIADEQNLSLDPTPKKIDELKEDDIVRPFQPTLLAQAEAAPIQPGTLQIKARVKLTYSF
ncbi:SIMPL domain-containing protein [Evansella halocellulosilytica]|uniref:SIMPL domain-containing protein n=1 Tax=Evansella halocellulosilytica TaxID=2011013 RepID=UPI0015CC5C5D|nr:SIMPL domain-containing protein [Evansella halocellulosilytica]